MLQNKTKLFPMFNCISSAVVEVLSKQNTSPVTITTVSEHKYDKLVIDVNINGLKSVYGDCKLIKDLLTSKIELPYEIQPCVFKNFINILWGFVVYDYSSLISIICLSEYYEITDIFKKIFLSMSSPINLSGISELTNSIIKFYQGNTYKIPSPTILRIKKELQSIVLMCIIGIKHVDISIINYHTLIDLAKISPENVQIVWDINPFQIELQLFALGQKWFDVHSNGLIKESRDFYREHRCLFHGPNEKYNGSLLTDYANFLKYLRWGYLAKFYNSIYSVIFEIHHPELEFALSFVTRAQNGYYKGPYRLVRNVFPLKELHTVCEKQLYMHTVIDKNDKEQHDVKIKEIKGNFVTVLFDEKEEYVIDYSKNSYKFPIHSDFKKKKESTLHFDITVDMSKNKKSGCSKCLTLLNSSTSASSSSSSSEYNFNQPIKHNVLPQDLTHLTFSSSSSSVSSSSSSSVSSSSNSSYSSTSSFVF